MGRSTNAIPKNMLIIKIGTLAWARHKLKNKAKKGILGNQNVMCSPRPPTLSQCHMDLHGWLNPQR